MRSFHISLLVEYRCKHSVLNLSLNTNTNTKHLRQPVAARTLALAPVLWYYTRMRYTPSFKAVDAVKLTILAGDGGERDES
jgi:hypothetical protein